MNTHQTQPRVNGTLLPKYISFPVRLVAKIPTNDATTTSPDPIPAGSIPVIASDDKVCAVMMPGDAAGASTLQAGHVYEFVGTVNNSLVVEAAGSRWIRDFGPQFGALYFSISLEISIYF